MFPDAAFCDWDSKVAEISDDVEPQLVESGNSSLRSDKFQIAVTFDDSSQMRQKMRSESDLILYKPLYKEFGDYLSKTDLLKFSDKANTD